MPTYKICQYCCESKPLRQFSASMVNNTLKRSDVCLVCRETGAMRIPSEGAWEDCYWNFNTPEKLGFKSIVPSGGL